MGVLVDSIHGEPLVGAEVTVVGTAWGTQSDSNGHFRIDNIPAGTYRLGIAHPLFDTLGVHPITQPLNLAPHRYVVLQLGTPSARALRSALCPNADTAATPSFIVGRVRSADTGEPADGAHVSLVYPRTVVGLTTGVNRVMRVRHADVGADGMYVLCGLEPDVHGTLQVEREGALTAEVHVSLDGKILALRSLSTGFAEAAPADSGRLQRGRATIRGIVVDSSASPVEGAIVAVTGTAATTRSGPRGQFTLSGLPSGTQELTVRSVGFQRVELPVELTMREASSVTVSLHQETPSLTPVVVTDTTKSALDRVGFFTRKMGSAGYFVTPDQVAKAQAHVATDLLRLVPGFQIQTNSGGQTVILPPRSAYAEGASACINYFVDGAFLTSLGAGEFDSIIPARDVVAIEAYSGSSVPAAFYVSGRPCETIVVWTRARVGER